MLPKQTSFASLVLALAVAGIAASGGFEAYSAMRDKAQAQAAEVQAFQQWKSRYTELLPVQERWDKSLPDASQVKDLYSVYKTLGESPRTDPDRLSVLKVERLALDGKELGGQRVCLGTLGAAGLLFREKQFEPLLAGLRALSERPDVQMGAVRFTTDKDGQAVALVTEFCLLFRDADRKAQAAQAAQAANGSQETPR